MRRDMAAIKEECDPPREEASGGTPAMVAEISTRQSPVVDPPRRSSTIDMTTESPVVEAWSSTSNNRSLAVMEASTIEAPQAGMRAL